MAKNVLAAMLLCGLAVAAAQAATAPDAGQLLREQQPQRQMPAAAPEPRAEPERSALPDTGERITVRGIVFTGYEGLASEGELQALVADAVGRDLSFSELRGLADRVTRHLKDKGWFLARAYLPMQDVTAGIVEVAVIQGTSDGGITIRRDKTARVREETVRALADRAVRPGQPVNQQALERAILLMNDLPGVAAKAALAPGAAPGSTGIQIDVSEGPLLTGSVWSDNQGNRYTGAWRGSGLLNVNDPSGCGDQLTLLLTGAEGLTQGRVGYTLPLTPDGLKGNLAYTGMRYELLGELASLGSEGQGHTVTAGASYPLLRRRTANMTAAATYEYKRLIDGALDVTTRDRSLHSGAATLSGDLYDTLLGGGYTTWSAGVTAGNMNERIADISLTKTEGAYARVNLGLSRLQRLTDSLALTLAGSGQVAPGNLDSSEKLNLGGPNGVRAYPVGEGSGDGGLLLSADLRYDVPLPAGLGTLQLSGLYDAGWVRLHKDPWLNAIPTATGRNDYWLQGAGAGLVYSYGSRFNLRATWAHTLGANAGRSTTGADADGRADHNRVWLQTVITF